VVEFDHGASVDAVRSYFDALADGEWERLSADLPGRVSFEVHRRFQAQFVEPGMRVLEVGAGPGRFTIELASLGARVAVTDISPVQLDLNRRHVTEAGHEASVESRAVLDICDLSRYADKDFDAVVAYGGPLSYAFDRVEQALAGLLRVTRPGGPVMASVMSTLGAYRHLLTDVVGLADFHGDDFTDRVLLTGDLREAQPPGTGQHTCRMFRSGEMEALVAGAGGRMLAGSASNWISLGDPAAMTRLADDPERWERFLRNEVAVCRERGVWDGGTHFLFATSHQPPS
jgi:ubiquinone/menaquinone biosynthesis C-methylase UbiE